MSFIQIIQVMLPIIVISGIGYIYTRFRKAEPQVVSELIIYLTIPALFFNSFYRNKLMFHEFPAVIITFLAVVVVTGLVLLVLNRFRKLPKMLFNTSVFMNSSFVGFPVMLLAYGQLGLTRAIAYDFVNGIFIFTLGIYLASQRKDFLELFKLPFFYAALLGLLFNLLGVRIPQSLLRPIEMLGGATIPLALLMLGFRLGMIKITSLVNPLISSALRMLLGAGIAYVATLILGTGPQLSKALIVMSSLPSAFMSLVLAEKYGIERSYTASAIAVCTLLSVVYLPVLLWLLR